MASKTFWQFPQKNRPLTNPALEQLDYLRKIRRQRVRDYIRSFKEEIMADATPPTIRTFQVFPDVPEKLQPLLELAHNLWWVWHPDAVELFRRLDRKLWEQVYHNPVKLLGAIPQGTLADAAKDEGYLSHM